jgi:hypothetical protein
MVCEITVDITLCVDALTRLTHLSSLVLSHAHLTDAHLCTLLPHLSHLSELNLSTCPELTSFTCLSHTRHISSTLHKLEIYNCRRISPIELLHLRALTALRSLALQMSLNAALDVLTLGGFTRDSPAFLRSHFPRLTKFEYLPPEDTDEDEDDDLD